VVGGVKSKTPMDGGGGNIVVSKQQHEEEEVEPSVIEQLEPQ